MRYCFGELHGHDSVTVEAKDLEHAIKIFKVSELFPEKCVDHKYYKRDHDGNFCNEYDSDLKRYAYSFKIDNPKIIIYEEYEEHEWREIGTIRLKECIEVDFREFIPSKNMIEAPKVFESKEKPEETLPVVSNAQTLSSVSSKLELRKKHDEIARRKAEMEAMISELNQAMDVLKEELKQKQKIVYIIETYLGIQEEIVQIADGDPAPEDALLTLYQQKLFMDEEVGIWDDHDGQGIDCRQIEQFDEWILKNYNHFAYEPLSIVAWQVRRREKEYGDLWTNVQFNQWNKATYFLIRNGSKIYRIWSNIRIDDRLFPTKNEYVDLINKERRYGEDRAQKELQKKHESYLYGLIAIQGIIERTDILGTRFRQNGVNLLTPRGNTDDFVRFVRDAEQEFWIGDGRPRWQQFLEANRETIKLGSRICIATQKYYFSLNSKDGDQWRCAPYRPGDTPSRQYCYTVEAFKGESKEVYFPHDTTIQIKYHPGDTIWDPVTFRENERKRRVPWFFYRDEVINFDEISYEEADYYMKCRLDRTGYIRMLPTLHWIKYIKLQEKALEDEFSKMIAGQLGWEMNTDNEKKIQEAITWWKLKNKWKRALTKDESKAVRMILKKLGKE